MNTNKINTLIREVVDKFHETTHLKMDVIQKVENFELKENFETEIFYGDKKFTFESRVETEMSDATLGLLISSIKGKEEKTLLFTNYVDTELSKKLKQAGIQYVDKAGNIFIKRFPLYIEIKGKKLQNRSTSKKTNRSFYSSGLKIIFAMLCKENLVNATYREIAKATGSSIGSITELFKDLRKLGFVLEVDGKKKVVKKEILLRKWIEAYFERLRPNEMKGTYSVNDNKWWKEVEISQYDALWSSEVGAAKITGYLKPQKQTIYAKGNKINRLIAKFGMINDPNGEVEILNKFWNFDTTNNELVPDILVYADLIGSGDERNIETARLLYEEKIEEYIRKN